MITATIIGPARSVSAWRHRSLSQASASRCWRARGRSRHFARPRSPSAAYTESMPCRPAGRIAIEDAARPSEAARGCDMLVVTTKTYDIAAALAPFAGGTPAPGAVLSLHNGLGASEAIRATLGPAIAVFASAMMIGLERQGLAHVASKAVSSPNNTGPLLGDATAPLERFVAAAQAAFLPMRVDPAMRDTILFKLLFNTCMNPTGALTGLTYGELVTHLATRGLIERVADETLAVLAAEHDYRPAETGAAYVRDTLTPIVLPRSAGHRSSMCRTSRRCDAPRSTA